MDSVEVDGLRIAYERVGAGPLLLLLHGYVSDGVTTFSPQLDALSADFTVVAWDAPGAGRSADPPPTFGMADYADCVAGFVATLGLGRPHVGGLSFGGALAIAFHGRHPSVPSTLVLASAYAGWAGSLGPDATEARLEQAMRLAELGPEELVAALLPTMFSASTDPDTVARFGASLLAFHPAGLRAMARSSAEDLRPLLGEIAIPTLLVYGDQDVRAPLHVAEGLQRALAGSTLVVLPGVGHLCTLEAPAAFNEAVRRFLLGVPS